MSDQDTDEIEEDEFTPKKKSAFQQSITTLMSQGMDYSQAYDKIINPKPQKIVDLYTPAPAPAPKPKIENLLTELNSDVLGKIELAAENIEVLEELVGKQNVKSIELGAKLKNRLANLKKIKGTLEKNIELCSEKEAELQKQFGLLEAERATFKKELLEFNNKILENKKKRKGYVKKIDAAALAEFNKSW